MITAHPKLSTTTETGSQSQQELLRCELEIAEILDREDVKAGIAPAYLVTLGVNDWQFEKRLIEKEMSHEN